MSTYHSPGGISTATSSPSHATKAAAEPIRFSKSKKRPSLSFKEADYKPVPSPMKKLNSRVGREITPPPPVDSKIADGSASPGPSEANRGNGKTPSSRASVSGDSDNSALADREPESQKTGRRCSPRLSAKVVLGTRCSPRPKPVEIFLGLKSKDSDHVGNAIMMNVIKKDNLQLLREFEESSRRDLIARKVLDRVVGEHSGVQFFYLDGLNKASRKYMVIELSIDEAVPFVVHKLENLASSLGTTPKKEKKKSVKSSSPTRPKKNGAKGKHTALTVSINTTSEAKRKGGAKKAPAQREKKKKLPPSKAAVKKASAQEEEGEKVPSEDRSGSTKTRGGSSKSGKALPLVPFNYTKSDQERIEGLKALKEHNIEAALTLIKIPPFSASPLVTSQPVIPEIACPGNSSPQTRGEPVVRKDDALPANSTQSKSKPLASRGEDVGLGALARNLSGLSLMEDDEEQMESLEVLGDFLNEAGLGFSPMKNEGLHDHHHQQGDLNHDYADFFSAGDSISHFQKHQLPPEKLPPSRHHHNHQLLLGELNPNCVDFAFSTGDAIAQGNIDQQSQLPVTKLSSLSRSSSCTSFSSVSFASRVLLSPNTSFGTMDSAMNFGVC